MEFAQTLSLFVGNLLEGILLRAISRRRVTEGVPGERVSQFKVDGSEATTTPLLSV
jgi:hypothetical protein